MRKAAHDMVMESMRGDVAVRMVLEGQTQTRTHVPDAQALARRLA